MANYRDLWNTIQQYPVSQAMDAGAAKRERTERQVNFINQLLVLLNDLKLNRSPAENEKEYSATKDLFSFLQRVDKKGQLFLHAIGETNFLTPEALQREGLRRQGIKIESVPQEKTQDPNL